MTGRTIAIQVTVCVTNYVCFYIYYSKRKPKFYIGSKDLTFGNVFVVAVSAVGQTPIDGAVRGSQRSRRAPPPPSSTPRPLLPAKNNRDASVTQFAVIDDENVSAMQQVTRGGGGDFILNTLYMLLVTNSSVPTNTSNTHIVVLSYTSYDKHLYTK